MGQIITLVFEGEGFQKESRVNYNIDLLILVIFIIISFLLILCIISSLHK